PVMEADERVGRASGGVRLALDLHSVAASGDVHAETVFDGDQVAVVITEQGPEQVRLVEFELEAGASLFGSRDGGKIAAGHQAASLRRTAPVMLLGPAATSVMSKMSPGFALVSTCTDCSQGERPIIWPPCLSVRSMRICVFVPTFDRLNASWCTLIRSCSRCRRSSMISGGIWSSIAAAGVPGRALYLNE